MFLGVFERQQPLKCSRLRTVSTRRASQNQVQSRGFLSGLVSLPQSAASPRLGDVTENCQELNPKSFGPTWDPPSVASILCQLLIWCVLFFASLEPQMLSPWAETDRTALAHAPAVAVYGVAAGSHVPEPRGFISGSRCNRGPSAYQWLLCLLTTTPAFWLVAGPDIICHLSWLRVWFLATDIPQLSQSSITPARWRSSKLASQPSHCCKLHPPPHPRLGPLIETCRLSAPL